MIIKFVVKKELSYDLSQVTRFRNFQATVNRLIKGKSDESQEELENILEQLQAADNLADKVIRVKTKIETRLDELLKEEALQKQQKVRIAQWEKTGESRFQGMYARLIADAKDFHGDMELMLAYSAHVLNLFIHMATVTPTQHHVASQEREYDTGNCLQYARSQGKHPNAQLYRKLGGFDARNRLPFNLAYYKALKDIDPEGFKVISQFYPRTGTPRKDTNPSSYANLSIAHAGLRRNNLDVLIQGLRLAATENKTLDKTVLFEHLTQILPLSHKRLKKIVDLKAVFNAYRRRLKQISLNYEVDVVGDRMMQYRLQRVQALEERIVSKKFKWISTKTTQKNTTCLFIRLFPEFNTGSTSVKDGITNTIIAIFSGIIQYQLQQKNLKIRAERRQSFGFLRPTLTDAGILTMRLSLGLEPEVFDEVVLDSLVELDKLLQHFNFQTQTLDLVKKVLEIKDKDESKSGQYAFILSAVASDKKTLNTYNQAQAYIKRYAPGHSLRFAVTRFLQDYILEDKSLDIAEEEYGSSAIKSQPQVLMDLLRNTVLYAHTLGSSLTFHGDLALQKSFLHAYKKLYKNIDESIQLLNETDQLDADDLFYKSTRYIENIIEYCLLLNVLNYPMQLAQNPKYDPIAILKKTELDYCRRHTGLRAEQIQVYFTDSGQQAVNLPILMFGHQYKTRDDDKACVQLFGKTYFEISSFFDDIKKDNVPELTDDKSKVKVLVVDITQIDSLKIQGYSNLSVCIIDITHYPEINNPVLKQKIKRLLDNQVTVVLSESMLKHEQLGQDKYQSGKIVILSPNKANEVCTEEMHDEFQSVSDQAMNPYLAMAFNMFNQISGLKDTRLIAPLHKLGVFSPKPVPKKTAEVEEKSMRVTKKNN